MINLTLDRFEYLSTGIFGMLHCDGTVDIDLKTLEHAYSTMDGEWAPKVPQGNYLCVRGVHRLLNGIPFETYEVMDVPGHSGILFHIGNRNDDSSGCILLGEAIERTNLLHSASAFRQFMRNLDPFDEFTLTVL